MGMAKRSGARVESLSGNASSATRDAIIQATEQLLRDEGYAALTSRNIGSRAGIKPPLIHYYFDSLDELYLTVFRQTAEEGLRRIEEALRSPQPVSGVWGIMSDPAGARFTMEFTALALHRAPIRAEMAAFSDRVRERITEGFEQHFARRKTPAPLPSIIVQMMLVALAAFLTQEKAISIDKGHDLLEESVRDWLATLDGP